jgi:proteasome lid subunit RPN8/RPN11
MKFLKVLVGLLFLQLLCQPALYSQTTVISVDTLHNNHDKFLVCKLDYARVPDVKEVRISQTDAISQKYKNLPIAEIIGEGGNKIKIYFYCYGAPNIYLKKKDYNFNIQIGQRNKYIARYRNDDQQDTIFDKQYVYLKQTNTSQHKPDEAVSHDSVWVYFVIPLFLSGIVFLFFQIRKKTFKTNIGVTPKKLDSAGFSESKVIANNLDREGDIVILDKQEINLVANVPFIAKGTTIELNEYFTDTAVSSVTWTTEAVTDIFAFVKKSLQNEPVPEVGGLLLGRINQSGSSKNEYKICIDAFLPDNESTFQDRFNLEFGANTFIDEFEYLEKHPGSNRVGWLHTHPGHSIFLSQTDINSHKTSFPAIYQIAVVIDTFDDFRTGIFSYTTNGEKMNNVINKSKLLFFKWENLF